MVFATETLAAGINMPARTTVVSVLSRRAGDRGHALLTHNQLLQMAGRAGRRGYDTAGASRGSITFRPISPYLIQLLQMAGRAGRRGYDTAGAFRAPAQCPEAFEPVSVSSCCRWQGPLTVSG